MTVFLLFLLCVATAILWTRADRLDRKLRVIEPRLDMLEWRLSERAGQGAQDTQPSADATVAPDTKTQQADIPAAKDDAVHEPSPMAPPSLIPATRAAQVTDSVAYAQSADPEDAAPEDATAESPSARRGPRFDFEDLFGRLLPIWAGGVALAVAGFFLVRYSIEQGLLGPTVRTALGFLFGAGLIAGAELAYRQEHRVADPRVRQALAGAGLATLYASFYMAGSLYGLIGPGLAFVGLAAVTAGAIALSFRFGLPSAILGLVGGFAAPVLVNSNEANLPLLALYLALVTGGLSFAGNRQGRSWLALAALAGGLGWGVLMLLSGVTGATDIIALGGYIVLLGAVIPAFTAGPDAPPVLRAIIAAVAAMQMAAMVSLAGHDPTAWSLYLLLAAALAFFAWREPRLRETSGFAALLSLLMLGLWNDAPQAPFIMVVAGLTAVFAIVPLAHVWHHRERWSDVAQIGVIPLGLALIAGVQFYDDLGEYTRAALALGFATIPAIAAVRRWASADQALGMVALAPLGAAAILVTIAGWCVVPFWAAVIPPAVTTSAIIALAFRREQQGLSVQAWIGFVVTVLVFLAGSAELMGFQDRANEITRLGEWHDARFDGQTMLRWIALLAAPLLFALRPALTPSRLMGEILATIAFYGLAAQFMPGQALGWLMAAMAVALALLPQARLPGAFTALAIAIAWALEPLAQWAMYAAQSLSGEAMLIAVTLGWSDLALRIAPPMLALAVLAPTAFKDDSDAKVPLWLGFGGLALVAAHIAFKQILAIASPDQFVALGLAERTLWQALLLGVAVALWKLSERQAGLRLASGLVAGAALAHFAIFSLCWHNPLTVAQAVGPWPLANLVLAAFGVALGSLALLRHLAAEQTTVARQLCDAASMGLIVLLTLGLLRQVFAGSILIEPPVGAAEDLLRSLLGILLAIGFLGWGAYRNRRIWRIGSLVVILAAVLKVFLFDAAGLEGLARIASFMVLGFSLIGIGWFYTRQLRSTRAAPVEQSHSAAISS